MRLLLAVMLLAICYGCSSHAHKQPETPGHTIPEALQDDRKSSEFKKRAPENLVEELYAEQIDKDSTLQALEQKLGLLQQMKPDSLQAFRFFTDKNEAYFKQAAEYTLRIRDSLLRNETVAYLTNTVDAFNSSNSSLNSLANSIENKSLSLDDRHTMLKLFVSLSMMKQYQREGKPSEVPLEKLVQQQDKLIAALDAAIQNQKNK
jgi:hypothetical protein